MRPFSEALAPAEVLEVDARGLFGLVEQEHPEEAVVGALRHLS